VPSLVFADEVHLHDVRVDQPRGGRRFCAEPTDELLMAGELGWPPFERNGPVELWLVPPVHAPHAPRPRGPKIL